jgi:hypothetical protein
MSQRVSGARKPDRPRRASGRAYATGCARAVKLNTLHGALSYSSFWATSGLGVGGAAAASGAASSAGVASASGGRGGCWLSLVSPSLAPVAAASPDASRGGKPHASGSHGQAVMLGGTESTSRSAQRKPATHAIVPPAKQCWFTGEWPHQPGMTGYAWADTRRTPMLIVSAIRISGTRRPPDNAAASGNSSAGIHCADRQLCAGTGYETDCFVCIMTWRSASGCSAQRPASQVAGRPGSPQQPHPGGVPAQRRGTGDEVDARLLEWRGECCAPGCLVMLQPGHPGCCYGPHQRVRDSVPAARHRRRLSPGARPPHAAHTCSPPRRRTWSRR